MLTFSAKKVHRRYSIATVSNPPRSIVRGVTSTRGLEGLKKYIDLSISNTALLAGYPPKNMEEFLPNMLIYLSFRCWNRIWHALLKILSNSLVIL